MKTLAVIQKDGIKGFFALAQKMSNKIYRSGTIVILKRNLAHEVPNKLTTEVWLKHLTKLDISKIVDLGYLNKSKVEEFFESGSKCLGVYKNNEICAYCWYHFKSYYFPFFDYKLNLNDLAYIGPVFVSTKYRGYGIHSAISGGISKILYNLGYGYAFGSVWPDNKLSINNIIKFGYKPELRIFAIRLFGKLVYRNIREVDSWDEINIPK